MGPACPVVKGPPGFRSSTISPKDPAPMIRPWLHVCPVSLSCSQVKACGKKISDFLRSVTQFLNLSNQRLLICSGARNQFQILDLDEAVKVLSTPLRETLACCICNHVSREPTICTTCGQLVGCYNCVLASLEHDERCPLCRCEWDRTSLTGFVKTRMNFDHVPGVQD